VFYISLVNMLSTTSAVSETQEQAGDSSAAGGTQNTGQGGVSPPTQADSAGTSGDHPTTGDARATQSSRHAEASSGSAGPPDASQGRDPHPISRSAQVDALTRAMAILDSLNDTDRRETLTHLQYLSNVPRHESTRRSEQTMVIREKCTPRLRPFSGRTPVPAGEITFAALKQSVMVQLEDPDCDEILLRRAIIDCLQEPASSSILTVRRKSPREILEFLSSLYGPIENEEELLIRFNMRWQDYGETASDFLKDLHSQLTHITTVRTMTAAEYNQRLCKQFSRGCTDDTLLLKLRLDDTISAVELITRVRTEEMKMQERQLHLRAGCSKHIQQQSSSSSESASTSSVERRLDSIEQMLHEVMRESRNQQGVTLNSQSLHMQSPQNASQTQRQSTSNMQFCYRCGQTGHYATTCWNPPNAELVEKMVKERRDRKAQQSGNGRR